MRTVTFGGANSLDNFIARKDDSFDWIMHGKEAIELLTEYWKGIDTILMGRKTYEVMLRHSKGQNNPYPHIKSYVFSRTLPESKDNGVEILRVDPVAFVRNLKEQKGKDICVMGGGEFAKPLFEAELIDEIGFNIHPILLGSGIPLFHEMSRQINLELIECRPFKNGCVYVSYRVKKSKPARRKL
jgi:dihydrofolate reductase